MPPDEAAPHQHRMQRAHEHRRPPERQAAFNETKAKLLQHVLGLDGERAPSVSQAIVDASLPGRRVRDALAEVDIERPQHHRISRLSPQGEGASTVDVACLACGAPLSVGDRLGPTLPQRQQILCGWTAAGLGRLSFHTPAWRQLMFITSATVVATAARANDTTLFASLESRSRAPLPAGDTCVRASRLSFARVRKAAAQTDAASISWS